MRAHYVTATAQLIPVGDATVLDAVIVGNAGTTSTVTVRAGTGAGTVIAVIDTTVVGDYQFGGVDLGTAGLHVTVTGAPAADVTIITG